MNSLNRKIYINYIVDILYPVALLIYMTPAMIWSMSSVSVWFGRAGKLLCLLCLWFFISKKINRNREMVLCILYFVLLSVVSLCNSESFRSTYDTLASSIGLIILATYTVKRDPYKFALYPAIIFSAWVILNTLTWREGGAYTTSIGTEGTFLGVSTSITQYQIPAMMFILLAKQNCTKPMKYVLNVLWWTDIVALIAFFIMKPCTTSMIVLAVMLVLVYCEKLSNVLKGFFNIVSYKEFEVLFWIVVAVNLGFIFFNMQSLFTDFIETYLHESGDLNNRREIWELVLFNISKQPLFGYGLDAKISFAISSVKDNYSTHNEILCLLYYGGIVGTVFLWRWCIRRSRH